MAKKKEDLKAKYDEAVAEIETEFKKKDQELEADYHADIERLQKSFEQRIEYLTNQHQEKLTSLNKQEEDEKAKFEKEKAFIEANNIELEDNFNADVAKLQSTRSDLLKNIQALKDELNVEEANFNAFLVELDKKKEESLETLKTNYENKQAKITDEFINRKKKEYGTYVKFVCPFYFCGQHDFRFLLGYVFLLGRI